MSQKTGKINPIIFGLAFGSTSVFFYLLFILLLLKGNGNTVWFFNSLYHGLDVGSIMRTEISVLEIIMGTAVTFTFCVVFGSSLAAIYNLGINYVDKNELTNPSP